MPITLNTPAQAVVANGYDVAAIVLRYDLTGGGPAMVEIDYLAIVGGKPSGDAQQVTMPEAAFLALAGATPRLKALTAIANALGLTGGSFTAS